MKQPNGFPLSTSSSSLFTLLLIAVRCGRFFLTDFFFVYILFISPFVTMNDLYDFSNIENNIESFFENYDNIKDWVNTDGVKQSQFAQILDCIADIDNKLNNGQRLRLVSLLECNEMLNFEIFVKFVTVLKYERLSKSLKIKLSKQLYGQFLNFDWLQDNRYLLLLNSLFNILSVGYLRHHVSLILSYLLMLSSEIDPKYNLVCFFNYKKVQTILTFLKLDPKILHLVVVFKLELTKMTIRFKILAEELNFKLINVKMPRNVFGKLDHVPKLAAMRNGQDLQKFLQNVQIYNDLIDHLNSLNLALPTSKRKFLNDSNNDENLSVNIYSANSLYRAVATQNEEVSIVSVLSCFQSMSSSYSMIKLYLLMDLDRFDSMLHKLLKIQNDTIVLTTDMNWIFKSVCNYLKYYPSKEVPVISLVSKLFSRKIVVIFDGTPDERFRVMEMFRMVQFINFDESFQDTVEELVESSLKLNDINAFRNLLASVSSWDGGKIQVLHRILSRIPLTDRFILSVLVFLNQQHLKITIDPVIAYRVIHSRSLLQLDLLLSYLWKTHQRLDSGSEKLLQDLPKAFTMPDEVYVPHHLPPDQVLLVLKNYGFRGIYRYLIG